MATEIKHIRFIFILMAWLLSGCSGKSSAEPENRTVFDNIISAAEHDFSKEAGTLTLAEENRLSGEMAEGPWFINLGGQFDTFIDAVENSLPRELYSRIKQGGKPENGKLWADYTGDVVEIGGRTCVEFVVGMYDNGNFTNGEYYALDAIGRVYFHNLEKSLWELIYENDGDFVAFIYYGENLTGKEQLLIDKVNIVYEGDLWAEWQFGLCEDDFSNGCAIVNEEESREHLTLYDGALISAFSGEGESLLMFDEFVAELRERPERCMLARIIHDGEIMSITETPYFQNEEEEYLSGTGTAVSNNGGRYVKYGGKIYYRLYERNYYEPEEINICIMELSDDGSREFLFPDDGFGNIYIYRKQEQACFILNRICGESYGVEYDFEQEIYGVSLDGEYLYHFGRGAIFAVDNERGLIIAQRTNDGICTIDIDSGHVNYLAQEGHTPLYYNPESGILYCADAVNNGWANPALCTINIHSGEENVLLDLEKETLNLLCGKPADWYRYRNITVEGDFLQLYLAGYSEATQKLTGSALLKIGADGFWAEIMAAPVDWFGKNKPFTISEENPFFDENTYGAYLSEGATIYMFGSNGEEKMLLDRADMFSIGLTCIDYRNGADYLFVGNREYVDGEFFFTVVEGISNYGENGYDIERCSVFRKNLETGEIVLLNKY